MNGPRAVNRPSVHTISAMSGPVGVAEVQASASRARADAVGYLLNVTVRAGDLFADADDALDRGHVLRDGLSAERSYAGVMASIKSDFGDPNDCRASHLIDQAVNELCPAQIRQLRTSAAGYRPLAP
jgi:hypothetical protein